MGQGRTLLCSWFDRLTTSGGLTMNGEGLIANGGRTTNGYSPLILSLSKDERDKARWAYMAAGLRPEGRSSDRSSP